MKWSDALVAVICIVGAVVGGITGWSARGEPDRLPEWQALMTSEAWNRRGFIGCEDGFFAIRNIDFHDVPLSLMPTQVNWCTLRGAPT